MFEKNEATEAFVLLGSTYVFEATFSCMVHIKSKCRNRLTDAHLQDKLIIQLYRVWAKLQNRPLWAIDEPFLPDWLGCTLVYHFVTFLSNYFGTSVFRFRVWSEVSTFKWGWFTPAYFVASICMES